MRTKLQDIVKQALDKVTESKNAKARVAIKAKTSVTTIVNILNGHIPLPENAERIAKYLGCSDQEAREIYFECASLKAKDKAS